MKRLKKITTAILAFLIFANTFLLSEKAFAKTYDYNYSFDFEDTEQKTLEKYEAIFYTDWYNTKSHVKKSSVSLKTTEKKGTLVIKTANAQNASKLDKLLTISATAKSCFPITLKIKGDKATSKAIIKKLQTQISHVNTYGIMFPYYHYWKDRSKDGYSIYTVSTDDVKTYYWACRTIEKLITWGKKQKACYRDDAAYFKSPNTLFPLFGDDIDFCCMSTEKKMVFLNETGAFSCYKYQKKANTGIYYNERWYNKYIDPSWHKNSKVGTVSQQTNFNRSNATNMKLFYQCKLYGVCEQFAKFELVFLRCLGINNAKYVSNATHAWTEMDVRSDAGVKDHIKCDYGFSAEKSKTFFLDQESPYTLQLASLAQKSLELYKQKKAAYEKIVAQLEQIQFTAPADCEIDEVATIIDINAGWSISDGGFESINFESLPSVNDFLLTASYTTSSHPGFEGEDFHVSLIWVDALNCWVEYELKYKPYQSVRYTVLYFEEGSEALSKVTSISQLDDWQRTFDQNGNILKSGSGA